MSKEYLQQDNILFPDFDDNFNEGIPSLGKYGRIRLRYLKTVKPALFLDYKQGGILDYHLKRVDEEAIEMLICMEEQYIKKNPLPKGDDFMAVVQARYRARDYAEEIVLHNLIYV